MGSQSINDFNNDNLSIKSNRSSINDLTMLSNRGRAVEKYTQTCGKSRQKSGKLSGKSGKPYKKISPKMAEDRAEALISYFNAPNCREFFLKCIYHLTDEDIYKAIENASKPYVNSPVKYFNKTCKQMMLKYGV